jgi:nifR3 family TIM-barrel protein
MSPSPSMINRPEPLESNGSGLLINELRLSGRVVADPPVVLAPMAGITNTAFRRLCREEMARALGPDRAGGLFVSEMITTRALVERNQKTMRLIRFEADETPRSIQLYGVDPTVVGAAVRMIVDEDLADHIDLNFGCPVPKVTRKGGGSALPWRIGLFDDIVTTAVREAGDLPVTVKMRVGIDRTHVTYREAGLRAQDAGVKHVALHGRTAADFYGGTADWDAIAELASLLDIPVLGNGDIWEAEDALRMVAETGCAGVVVGRGCLGRPWLFADLAAAFDGRPNPTRPHLAEVARIMRRHAELLTDWAGSEHWGVTDFRKHVAWYLKGFAVGSELRVAMAQASSLAELDDLLARLDLCQPFPEAVVGQPRGRTSGARGVVLPEGWLDTRESRAVPAGAELAFSGG